MHQLFFGSVIGAEYLFLRGSEVDCKHVEALGKIYLEKILNVTNIG